VSQHKSNRAASFRPCAVSAPPGGGEADASGRERRYTELSSASLLRAAAARPAPARFQAETASDADAAGAGGDAAGVERVGVLLLNLGGPESLEDVQPFLYNLFADPDIIRLPSAVSFMQKPLAGLISTLRAPKVRASVHLRTCDMRRARWRCGAVPCSALACGRKPSCPNHAHRATRTRTAPARRARPVDGGSRLQHAVRRRRACAGTQTPPPGLLSVRARVSVFC
jgi:hypothetical protein